MNGPTSTPATDTNIGHMLRLGATFVARDGRRWTWRGFDADRLGRLESRGERLRLPGEDGIPRLPDERALREAIRLQDLRRLSPRSDVPARRIGRGGERTKEEVLADDPKAALRMRVCRGWDAAARNGARPALDPTSLRRWLAQLLGGDALLVEFGMPSPSAARNWIRTRGTPDGRRWCDMEDLAGQGTRRKRITGLSYQLAEWHATRVHSRNTLTPAAAHRALERDYNRAVAGEPLKMDRFEPVERDAADLKLMDRTTFRKLVAALDTSRNDARRTSHLSMRSRRGGEGASIEAVRFGQIVQLDEKESSAYVLVDEARRIPLGSVTTCLAVDCRTTAITGFVVDWAAPSTSTMLRTILHCASLKDVPKPFRQDFPDLELLATRISELIVDNASHLSGETIQDLGGDLVMDVTWAGVRVATHKALVESRHAIIRRYVDDRLPSHKLPIQVAREFGIDLAERTAIDISTYRTLFALGVAEYNVTRRTDLGGSSPLELAMLDIREHGLQLPADLEQFERAAGEVSFSRVIGGEGVVVDGLVYAHETEHARLLDDLVQASSDRRRTRRLRLDCKVKAYPHTVERVAVFNPLRGEYEDLLCKRRRYAAGLTPELHRIIRQGLGGENLDRISDERLLEVRGTVEDLVERADPGALARGESSHERILSDPRTLAMAADRREVVRTRPSPTGLETVAHDLDLTRKDAATKPIRRKRGREENDLAWMRGAASHDDASDDGGSAARDHAPAGDAGSATRNGSDTSHSDPELSEDGGRAGDQPFEDKGPWSDDGSPFDVY